MKFEDERINLGIKIFTAIVSAGIVPLVKVLTQAWKDGAPEREARREFRLRRLQIKNMKKEE